VYNLLGGESLRENEKIGQRKRKAGKYFKKEGGGGEKFTSGKESHSLVRNGQIIKLPKEIRGLRGTKRRKKNKEQERKDNFPARRVKDLGGFREKSLLGDGARGDTLADTLLGKKRSADVPLIKIFLRRGEGGK